MAINSLTVEQIGSIANDVYQQATGQKAISAVTPANFVSVGQTVLNTGYDTVINAISQVLSRTIFSVRPYYRKFPSLSRSEMQYGNHVRKLQMIDGTFNNNPEFDVNDGESVDMFTVNSPKPLQLNFYGQSTFSRNVTIYRDQLNQAFSSLSEFGSFISMVYSNINDQIEQCHESIARATVANFINGKVLGDKGNVIHLITEYNTKLGYASTDGLTAQTIYQPENFPNFMKFVVSRIKQISSFMTERQAQFHINVEGKEVMRHTPYRDQLLYLYAPDQLDSETTVLSSVFHDDYLKLTQNELVNFWQNPLTPDTINNAPVYLNGTTGELTTGASTTTDKVFGLLADVEAIGYTTINHWSAPTPFNAAGGYTNTWWHFTDRYWNDFTENGVVFLLD